MTIDPNIQNAIRVARLGHKQRAAHMLRKITEKDPNNADAWYYLAGMEKDRVKAREYLQHVVQINPLFTKAKLILEKLEAAKQVDPKPKKLNVWTWITIALGIIFFFGPALVLYFDKKPVSNPTSLLIATDAVTPVSTLTPQQVNSSTPIPVPTKTASLVFTPSPTPDYPLFASISKISGHKMLISLDCEANSASIFAEYFGKKIDEVDFFISLPVSDNPDKGFVGDVHDEWGNLPPKGYGVYPAPVVALLAKRGFIAKDKYGFSLDELKKEIAAQRPVIVWVTGRVEPGQPQEYTSSDGLPHIVAKFEHTVLVIGYTPWGVTVLDGDTIYSRSTEMFLSSWSVLGNMAIIKSEN